MEEKKCNFYNKIDSCERCELGSILYKGKSNYKYHIDCRQNDNCYYKQLQLKDKMIELMAKDIIWLCSNKDKKSNGKQIDIVLSNYKQQALTELEE